MATTPPFPGETSPDAVAPALDPQHNDPFHSVGPSHRFSHFNAQLFALGPDASPAQAKRALEAHLAETDRRMEEAGKLGTALVQQRNELVDRLKDVEKLQTEGELSDDLRQKLADIEKDYNEVARESARAFLPKSRVPSNETSVGSPFVPEGKGGRRSVSPSKFETQATASPAKLSVPNRKIRNQPSARIHDIEFAAEISTSLIAQVRNLQGLLAEKEEELKETRAENSKLEYEVEGFQQRLKTLDDSEHRYKDENWNLETQIHELMAKEKEAADREKKLTQALNLLQSEKNTSQRELDEIKLSHAKLVEEHAASVKHHDIELGTAKRTMVMGESERAALQKKIEELTGQNTELAKAVSVSIRGRKFERDSIRGMSDEDFHTAHDNTTPEQSPPPSPVKVTPRHSMLESETLKSSLAHAQRTIQGLRTNVHREKTERMETKRLLQEARDEIEKMRTETLMPTKRVRKNEQKEFKKPPRLLGALRNARSEVFVDDPNWEDQPDVPAHPRSSPVTRETTMLYDPVPEHTDHFETANETSDAAFETANENGAETDDFHTGAEEFSSDDVETETDSPSKRRTLVGKTSSVFNMQRSGSIDSTASTEDEDFPYEDSRTPTSVPPLHTKFPLRVSRGAFRRSRHASEEPTLQSSPASFIRNSNMSTPQKHGQSLAAELGDFDGSDNESNMSATPSKRSIRVRAMTPPPAMPLLRRATMVDNGTMTEPLHDSTMLLTTGSDNHRPMSLNTVVSRFSLASDYSDAGTQDLGAKLAEFPTPPTSSHKRDFAFAPELALSNVHSHDLEPVPEPNKYEAQITTLRAEHEEQIKNRIAENSSTHAAAIEMIKSQHADELAANKHAHAQDLAALRNNHADATDKAIADIKSAHTREIESIQSRHADELGNSSADALASYSQELESLKILHTQQLAEQLAQKESEIKATHTADLEALKVAHAEELARKESEIKAAHAADMEALKAAHAGELARRELEIKSAHAIDLESLKTAHAEVLSRQQSESEASFAANLELLMGNHAKELSSKETESKAAYDTEIEALKTTHAEESSRMEAELKLTAATEFEALKTAHSEELSNFRSENEALHATELAALVEAHTGRIEATKKEMSESHARKLDDLKSTHAGQIDHAKQTMEATYHEQLENLKTSHLQQIDEIKASIIATHAEELDSLRAAHAQQIENIKDENTTAQAAAIASLTDSHARQLDDAENSLREAHLQELESLKASHAINVETLAKEKDVSHATAIATLTDSHRKRLDEMKDALSVTHTQELDRLKTSHVKHLEDFGKEKDAAHATALAAMVQTHSKQLQTQKADSEAVMSKEIVSLKTAHAAEVEALNSQHAAAHAKELESFKAAIAKQIDSSKTEGDAAHNEQIEAINAAHAEVIAAHMRDAEIAQSQALEALKSSHERQIDSITSEHAASRTRELEQVTQKHLEELEDLRAEHASSKAEELKELSNKHLDELKRLQSEHETSKSQLREELQVTHSKELGAVCEDINAAHSKEMDSLRTKHAEDSEILKSEHEASKLRLLEELEITRLDELETTRKEIEAAHAERIGSLHSEHAAHLETLKREHETSNSQMNEELGIAHSKELETLRLEIESSHSKTIAALRQELDAKHLEDMKSLSAKHAKELEILQSEHNVTVSQRLQELVDGHSQKISELESAYATSITSLRAEHKTSLEQSANNLEAEHLKALEALKSEWEAGQSAALSELGTEHTQHLDQLKSENDTTLARELESLKDEHARTLDSQARDHDAALVRELDALNVQHGHALASQIQESNAALNRELEALKAEHTKILESQIRESNVENENLLASHAAELKALRASLTVVQPTLGYSSLSSVETEPVELPEIRSPRREAFIIPQDREPVTPHSRSSGRLAKHGQSTDIPIIAEDDTRQSPSAIVRSETPDSQQPFKEITTNTDVRPSRKPSVNTCHQSSQTSLTAEGLDRLLRVDSQQSRTERVGASFDEATGVATPSTVRIRRSSTDSLSGVSRTKHRTPEVGITVAPETGPSRRPGSAASARSFGQNRPPLPPNHREVIEAARTSSSHGGKGSMGPPLLPASAYRPSSSRPETPSSRPPLSPSSVVRGTPTPRANRTPGYADVQSPTKMPIRSRQSSISSFASEIDTRFNIHNGMGLGPGGFAASTDPRMIQAVTQTMIGEYLWKYTRKAGRGEMSENRHRRFFWVHPYTRTLYWSDSDPATAGRGEMRAKSVPIEAVRVVADDNPMPPGLHRKSLIVIAPGRTVKFTCTTGQRHETWFNALSYLLLRSGSSQDAEDVAGNMTQEDVDEFNPSIHRPETGQRPRPPPSLSSYNSRTTRNESPSLEVSLSIPTLTPTHEKEAVRNGTFGRLSGYWKSSSLGRGTFSSLRSRSYQPYDRAIYEASEVPDSAEDLRQIIEEQDRESDRLENVRACCDGKHDVSTLSHTSKRGRLPSFQSTSHIHTHPGPSGSQSAISTTRSRA
ncbi:hypothetical protein F4802DRAFT_288615 [Xylaria palmicola]|nr:hypothetical protein F4802DRAFT_288615 [Xylaria palmicola]